MVVLTFKTSEDLAAAVRRRAAQTDRTVSAEIRRALRAHLSTPEMSEAAPAGGSTKASDEAARHAA